MKKIVLFFIIIFFSFYKTVFASEEFTTICKTTYQISETGTANITQEISLVNQKPDLYVSEYTLNLTDENVQNARGWDRVGPLKTKVFFANGSTNISVSFNEKVVGKGQTLSFIIKYEIPKFAKKEGQLTRIVLPKLGEENLPNQFNLEVKTPSNLGFLAFSSLPPKESFKKDNFNIFTFDKNDFINTGVILEFGEYQIFDFSLTYYLQNLENQTVIEKISLPPDTNYQSVEYFEITPNPLNLTIDEDGNWLASFELLQNLKLEIKVQGRVKIFPSFLDRFSQNHENLNQYLAPKAFWEVDDQKIKKLAKKFKNPKEIYDFVINTLSYDYEKLKEERKRYGAIGSLDNPNRASCLEFTDLFVALARASGIPAREIEGFAYTDDPKLRPLQLSLDILHSWPEYYDQKSSSWKMIDPTWGKTTGGFDYFNNFDMSHFTFVIHGLDSQYPLPPGSYKQESQLGKNIFVEFGNNLPTLKSKIDLDLAISSPNFLKREVTGFLEIKNLGPSAVYKLPIQVITSPSININFSQSEIPYLLPFGKSKITFNLKNIFSILKNVNEELVTVKVGDQEIQKSFNLRPELLGLLINILCYFLITIFLVLVISFVFHFLHIKRFKKK